MQRVSAGILWEVIIIDNACTDKTAEVAKAEWEKYDLSHISFRIISEHTPGVSNAREKGVQTALYKYILFCDDDNWLKCDYLDVAYKIIFNDKKIAALGGQSTATSTISLPHWFKESQTNYAVGKQAFTSCDITYRKHLWSSGIVINKELYQRAFKDFPYILGGRKGKKLGSGEDSEICMRFILMGYKLYYSEELQFVHCIPKERLTINYNEGLMDGFIEAHEMLNIYAVLIDIKSSNVVKRYIPALKSATRIILAKILNSSRWNLSIERLNIYLLTNFKIGTIDNNVINIKEFSRKARDI